MRYNFVAIQRLIEKAFSNDEFLNLCQDYFRSVQDEFTTDQTRSQRIGLLIQHLEEYPNKVPTLLEEIKGTNPGVYGEFQSRLFLVFSQPSSLCQYFQERAEERQILDYLNMSCNSLIGIFGLVGCGKSQLAAQIFKQSHNFQKYFWCNFQENHSFKDFLLAILEEGFSFPYKGSNSNDKQLEEKVIDCLNSARFLLVLDDAEVLSESKDLEAYRKFLERWQSDNRGSSILLTSRKRIKIQSCQWFQLSVLDNKQSIKFLQEAGVDENDFKKLVDLVTGHPLLLNFAAKRKNLERIDSFKSNCELFDQLSGFHRNNDEFSIGQVLKGGYECLSSPLKKLLQSVSIYRIEFNLEAIHKVTLDERISQRELNELVEQSFLLEVQQEQLWESHPLIKPYVQDSLLEDDRKRLHRQAISYYDAVKHSTWKDLKDTTEYQELFYHLCELQQYLEALNLLWQSGENSSLDVFLERRGYNSIRVDLYELLRKRWQPADGEEWKIFGKMLNCLGNAYRAVGKNRLAQALHEHALQISRKI
jgi:hypothetical protein